MSQVMRKQIIKFKWHAEGEVINYEERDCQHQGMIRQNQSEQKKHSKTILFFVNFEQNLEN